MTAQMCPHSFALFVSLTCRQRDVEAHCNENVSLAACDSKKTHLLNCNKPMKNVDFIVSTHTVMGLRFFMWTAAEALHAIEMNLT